MGVFSDSGLCRGDTVCIDRAVLLTAPMTDDVAEYAFELDVRRCKAVGWIGEHVLAFGLSSFINHADEPNCDVEFRGNAMGFVAVVRALSDVQPSEELFISYADIEWYYDNGLISRP